MQERLRRTRLGIAGCAGILMFGGIAAPQALSQGVGTPDLIGQWTEPFEEGGADTPRCVPAEGDTEGFVVCKPVAQASAVLPDGRVFFFNGIESQENAGPGSVPSLSPSSRDSQARVLDLRSGTPQFVTPAQPRGGQTNPNIEEGHQSYDDPVGAIGVPGRPGDGLVGSVAGQLGVPESNPTSSPDDPSANDGDMFCADLTLLPDGRVLVAGGTDWYNEPSLLDRNAGDPADVGVIELEGLRNTNTFDYRTNSFTAVGHMKYGRWYPGMAIGADGKARVFSGVTQLISDTQLSQVRRVETFDPVANTWAENYTDMGSENSLPLQPRILLTPNGKFFYTGVGQMWGPFGEAADEVTFALQQFFDAETNQWEIAGVSPLGARSGAFVAPLQMKPPYDKMDIVTFGGTLGPPPGNHIPANPFTTITTVDKAGNVAGRMAGNLNTARWFASGIMLPTGELLAVGGGDLDEVVVPGIERGVRTSELFDPATGAWTEVASHSRDRAYHNSALLLPDMRVLLGGHSPIGLGYGGPNRDAGPSPLFANNDKDPSFEVWSPPYLFRGGRPTISRAQAGISFGETFTVGTPQAGEIDSVVLLRVPSPQHVNDSDQRNLALDFTKTGSNTVEAVAPPDGNAAPPGHYYLVVMKKTDQGPVPSVARIVTVGLGTNLSEALQPYPDDTVAPVGGSATPDPDSSATAQSQAALAEAAQNAPAPLAQPAQAAADVAGEAYGALGAVPASNTRPFPVPVLPAAAAATTLAVALTSRRWVANSRRR